MVSITRFHRIQASPGFRRAAEYCVDAMLEVSGQARVIHYPAEVDVKFWHLPSFEEWSARRATLKITSPEGLSGRIADFQACKISLIQRSAATPRRGIVTEIVYAGEGRDVKDYKRARGKLAICDSHYPHDVYDAAVEAGVSGIILYRQRPLDPVRKGHGVQGVRQYNSFWWDEKDLFGFVLTPEIGEEIVSYLMSPAAKKTPVKVRAHVESERYPGTLEVVSSLIPGREEKEVLLIAHLCHPQPSAGDNASGAAVLVEAHRILNELIRKRELPVPRYGIRFLLVPEITGTLAYLSRERVAWRNLITGLNLDMVGQRQDVTGSTLCLEKPPLAASCFSPYVLEHLVESVFAQSRNIGGTASVSSIRWRMTPFSGGSDHAILSDPTVGVPTPMLIQWPDRYYHTSGDTPEKISPDLLRRTAIVAATCVYTSALASEDDMLRIAALTGRQLRKSMIDEMGGHTGTGATGWITPRYRARVLLRCGKQALRSVGRMIPESGKLQRVLEEEEQALERCAAEELRSRRRAWRSSHPGVSRRRRKMPDGLTGLVVKRLLPGPVDVRALLRQLSKSKRAGFARRLRKQDKAAMMGALGLYWADGRRSIAEISRLVAVELGDTEPRFLRFYFGLLEDVGLVEIKRK